MTLSKEVGVREGRGPDLEDLERIVVSSGAYCMAGTIHQGGR
jgi:hypothetical protein